MSGGVSRRQLFARFRGGPPQVRPPWSLPEEVFLEHCTQCGGCVDACPQGIIRKGHAGFPTLEFALAGCTFCGRCVDACQEGCFVTTERRPETALALVAVVSDTCVEARGVTCRMCQSECEADAIRFRPQLGGRSQLLINAEHCTGCGACIAPCPVDALSLDEPMISRVGRKLTEGTAT